jgi:hypothetical protein
MPNGFLNGMGWVIDQEEKWMACAWKWCEHENYFNLQGHKKSYKSEKYALFFKGSQFCLLVIGCDLLKMVLFTSTSVCIWGGRTMCVHLPRSPY